MNIIEALKRRHSTRAYLAREVPRDVIERILDAARFAPSGVNIQPWHVAVIRGEKKRRLGEAIIAAREAGYQEDPDYGYYPAEWFEPYKSRRKGCGLALYGALGIGRDDTDMRKAAWYANYRFFDAPVGLLFFMDRALGQGAYIDMGIFLQSVMLAAADLGLATCPQAALAEYPHIIREQLDLDPRLALVCGMALGWADPEAAINTFRTDREPVDRFTRWYE